MYTPVINRTLKRERLVLQRDRDRYLVTEDFKAKDKNQLSVKRGEIVYLVSTKKDDRNWMYVCNGTADKLGLVPTKILLRKSESNNNVNDGKKY